MKALPSGIGGPLAKKNGNGNGQKKGGPITPLEITETPLGNALGPGQPPFQESDSGRDQVINKQWKKEAKGKDQLQVMLNGNGGGPSGGPGPDGNGTTGNGNGKGNGKAKATKAGVNWGRIGHIAKETAMYGSGAAYGRYRYREWKEEGALSEGRAQQMAKDTLGDSIQEDSSQANYYDILGISSDATTRGVQNAYRAKSKDLHPDVNPSPEAAEAFRILNEAYETLKDNAKREAYDKAQAAKRVGKGWEDLPGSYQKKFRGQARKQIRNEAQVYSEARRLGIPIESPVMKQWDQMTEDEKRSARQGLGMKEGEDPAASTRSRMAFPVGKGKKSVAQLASEIETYKKGMATTKAEKGLAEKAASEASPDKRKKALKLAGKAYGQLGKAGQTPLGRRVRQSGGSHSTDMVAGLMTTGGDSLRTLQATGSQSGAANLRAAVGTSSRLKATNSQGRLTKAGGPATRRRPAYAGKLPVTSSGRRQIRGL